MVTKTGLLDAIISHTRHSPTNYHFNHNVQYLVLNLNELEEYKSLNLLSLGRFNLFSIFPKDYGFTTEGSFANHVTNALRECNIDQKYNQIMLVTMPKILGYVFNPVSFWMCFDDESNLCLVLAEVNNTFGERHIYICSNDGFKPISLSDNITCKKIFHVSPFFDIEGHYKFNFDVTADKINIDITYYKLDTKLLSTSIRGKKVKLTDRNLMKYFISSPLMLFKVIFMIHYHAVRLWLKKIKFYTKPKKPQQNIS